MNWLEYIQGLISVCSLIFVTIFAFSFYTQAKRTNTLEQEKLELEIKNLKEKK